MKLQLQPLPRRRLWLNRTTSYVVALGGAGVIGAIGLIFFYLLWVVAPIFSGASVEADNALGQTAESLLLDVNESGEIGLSFDATGELRFFELAQGETISTLRLDAPLVLVKAVQGATSTYAALDVDGGLWFINNRYSISFDGDTRSITPEPQFPFDREPVDLGDAIDFDVTQDDEDLVIASLASQGTTQTLSIAHYRDIEPGYALEFPRTKQLELEREYTRLYFGPRGKWLFLLTQDGQLEAFDVKRPNAPKSVLLNRLVPENNSVTALKPLLGRHSILVADDRGGVSQWFLLRNEFGYSFQNARRFETAAPVRSLVTEPRRKGFIAVDEDNRLYLFHTTSERNLAEFELPGTITTAAISPRSNQLLVQTAAGDLNTYRLHNEHPEISWSSLWSKVWYEGYEEPVYSWQSSSADNDFEPKFSLMPLAFGTLKAALYAMLFAVPIAIMGALYTAYFMTPSMRRIVKPSIEIMAALPTVILGFLAGLWLAPLVEANLHSIVSIFLVLPLGMLAFARVWDLLPDSFTIRFEGWYGALAVPIIVFLMYLSFQIGPGIEATLFDGDTRTWVRTVLGLDYDQRNALIVGIAMGLAVIPTIFSIAEDAIYGVPQHLTQGSLALGATEWQTLMRVVILTASPGIFSAIMIGLGRAVGETMIVLMATGNTPVMDLNIFQGMRTFAANIAVELPESEVDSTHYRILFLAALVLFLITFLFNTVAELVRQRLRARYGNL